MYLWYCAGMTTRTAIDEAVDLLEALTVGAVAVTSLALEQASVELTFAQWRVLMVLADEPDGATVSAIAARIGSANSPASRLIERMRLRGLVETGKDELDRRATRVRLAEEGGRVRERVVVRRRGLLREVLAPLGGLSPEAEREVRRLAAAVRSLS